jgi:hypothetical protein
MNDMENQVPQPTALDPQQKQAFDLMVKQAMAFLLKDEHALHIVAKAKAGDPREAVVEAVAPLLRDQFQMASLAGAKVEMVTLLAAGIQIIAVLAKMLEAAGILTEQQIPSFAADVAKMAVEQHNQGVSAPKQGGMAGPQEAPQEQPQPGV